MVYRGSVKRGVVVLDDATGLLEGTRVTVRPVVTKRANAKPDKPPRRTLAERLRPFIGQAKTLPADASENLDHYLYGLPKRS